MAMLFWVYFLYITAVSLGLTTGFIVQHLQLTARRLYNMQLSDDGQWRSHAERTNDLRQILTSKKLTVMPCCFDGLSARLVESAGFNLTFMTGFGVSATYGLPDTGLVSVSEMLQNARTISSRLRKIPCIGDGDTGYGNAINVRKTIVSYAQAGMSGIMLEDQVAPKRCGHTPGREVVAREEAYRRIQAAVDARKEFGLDIIILARTDARVVSLDEAITRCKRFIEIGADWTFLEAPQSVEEMKRYCNEVPGPKLANMLEFGSTPVLPPKQLEEMGYTVAAYPLTLLSASTKAMKRSLELLKEGKPTESEILNFEELKDAVGFPDYYDQIKRYT